jgi:hypothetical protein
MVKTTFVLLELLLCLLFLMTHTTYATPSAGLIAVIKKDLIEELKQISFESIIDELKHIEISNIKEGNFDIQNIAGTVQIGSPDDIQLSFDEPSNALRLSATNVYIDLTAHLKYRTKLLKTSGSVQIKGTVDNLLTKIGIDTQSKGLHLIPRFVSKAVEVDINKNKIDFNVKCHRCPNKVINSIIKLLKRHIVKKLEGKLKGIIGDRLPAILNKKMQTSYPVEVEITEGVSISFALTGPYSIKSEYLIANVDGTIFATSKGYNRPTESHELSVVDITNLQPVTCLINDYFYKTIENTLKDLALSQAIKVRNFDVVLHHNGSIHYANITSQDDIIFVKTQILVEVPKLEVGVQVLAELMVTVGVLPGDENHMVYIQPKFLSETIKFEIERYFYQGREVEELTIGVLLEDILNEIAKEYQMDPIGIRNLKTSPLDIISSTIKINPTYTEIGANAKIKKRVN